MTPDVPLSEKSARSGWLMVGLVLLVLGGLAALAAATGWEEMWMQVSRLGAAEIALLLGLSLVNYGLRALRWHVFTRTLGVGTTLLQDIRHYLGGFAMVVTPARLGELVRMRWLARETGWSFERTAPLALTDRASDLAAMGALLAIAFVLAPPLDGLGFALPLAAVTIGVAVLATRPRLLSRFATEVHRMLGKAPRFFVRLRRAGRSLSAFSNGLCLTAAVLLGLVGWLAEAYAFYLLLGWMGADIGLATATAIFLFATLAGGLTGAPGGVGGAEITMIALLQLEGVPPDVSIPATVIIRATTLWFAILIGLAAFPLAERLSSPEPRTI